MDYSYALMDMMDGRQGAWEDSPTGWPQRWDVDTPPLRRNGRPIAPLARLEAGHFDDLGTAGADSGTGGC